jgi:Tfp pilus assembly protein PilN
MADIDMIPRSYHQALRLQRTLLRYGAACALLLAVGGGCAIALRSWLARETPRMAQLREDAARAAALQTLVAAAEQRRTVLAANARAYTVLRGAGASAALARALDAALNDKIWLERVEFARTHELQQGAAGAAPAGALRVDTSGPAGAQAWRIASHVDIDGHALDQAALAAFLAALSASPALAEVHFVDSGSAPGESTTLAFRASATLRQPEAAP